MIREETIKLPSGDIEPGRAEPGDLDQVLAGFVAKGDFAVGDWHGRMFERHVWSKNSVTRTLPGAAAHLER